MDTTQQTTKGSGPGMTIRGRLSIEQLKGIFQMLTSSGSQGTLLVRHAEREKRICVRPDEISLLSSGKKLPRIGDLLVSMGKLTRKQLQAALIAQRSSRQRLGELLVEQGVIAREDIHDAVRRQIEEEITEIFCWEQAQFEYRDGPPEAGFFDEGSPLTSLALPAQPLLDGVMQRMGAWDEIARVFPTFCEVLLFEGDPEKSGALDHVPLEVLELLDGANSVEDLLAATCLPRFETAQSLVRLLDLGLIRRVMAPELCAGAEEAQKADLVAKEIKLLSLAHHAEPTDRLIHEKLAAAYLRMGNDKQAARLEFLIAENEELLGNLRGAAETREKALAHDPANLEARHTLLEFFRSTNKEDKLLEHGKLLAGALLDRRQPREALAIVEKLQQEHPRELEVYGLAVNANLALKDEAAALVQYEALARCLAETGDTARLAETYKKMLHLDGSRKDLARELKNLQKQQRMADAGYRRKRRLIQCAAAAAVLLVAGAGFYEWSARRAVAGADRLLAERDYKGAQAAYQQALDGYGFSLVRGAAQEGQERAAQKLGVIARRQALQRRRKLEALRKKIEAAFGEADKLLAAGRLEEARRRFAALAAQHAAQPELLARARKGEADAQSAFDRSWEQRIEQAEGRPLPARITALDALIADGPPGKLAQRLSTARDTAVEAFARQAVSDLDARLRRVLALRKQGDLPAALSGFQALAAAAEAQHQALSGVNARPLHVGYCATMGKAAARTQVELEALSRQAAQRRNEADALLARARAADPRSGPLYAQAFERYRALLQDPGLRVWPAARGIKLPLQVDSIPSGAELRDAGSSIGKTPALLMIDPGDEFELELRLRGYQPGRQRLGLQSQPVVRVALRRAIRWKRAAGGLIEGRPVLAGGKLVFGARDGVVYALDALTGAPLWQRQLDAFEDVSHSPLVAGKTVIVWTVLGSLYCLETGQGGIHWKRRKLEAGSELHRPPLLVAGKLLAIGRNVTAHDPTSGKQLWKLVPEHPPATGLVLAGDRLLFGDTAGRLLALSLEGKVVGRAQLGSKITGEPLAHAGRILVPCESGLVGLDAAGLVPQFKLGLAGALAGLAPHGAELLALSATGELLVIDPAGGRIARRQRLVAGGASLFGSPPVIDGTGLLLAGLDGSLYCFEAASGGLRWRLPTGGKLTSPPLVAGQLIFFGSHDKTMYALDR